MKRWCFAFSLLLTVTSSITGDEPSGDDSAESTAVAEIHKLGGSVRHVARNSEDKEIDFRLRGSELTDAGLVHLANVKQLVLLHLKGTKITDEGLMHLKGLTALKELHLEETAVGDAGLVHLADLANLAYLNLYGTQVSDAGLVHLKNLKKLKCLYLWRTDVTDDGVDQLAEALPQLRIVRGADLDATLTVRQRVVIDQPLVPIAGEPWKITGIRYEKANPGAKAKARIFYRTKGATEFAAADLVRAKEGPFEATLPPAATKNSFQYYIEIREPRRPRATYPVDGAGAPVEVQPDSAPPVLPADLATVDVKSYHVVFRWKDATDDIGVASYNVYRGKDQAGVVSPDNLLINMAVDKPLFRDAKPPADQTVWYAVQPIDVAGRAGAPRTIKIVVPKDMPPANDLKVTATAGSKAVVLNWAGAMEPDVKELLVFRADTADGELVQVAKLDKAVTRWIDTKAQADKKYRYTIKLRDAGNHLSAPSNEALAVAGGFLRRINCGGPLVESADGSAWEADTGSVGGTGRFDAKVKIAGTIDELQRVYQTERWSYQGMRYRIKVSPGLYLVTLHFAETNRTYSVKGKRLFDIHINGEKRHSDVDVFSRAGGAATAWQLPIELLVIDYEVLIELRKGSAGPALKGLEVRELPTKKDSP